MSKPACFGIEYGSKPSCQVCWHGKECKEALLESIAQDGRNPEPIETHIDDPRFDEDEKK